MNLTNPFADIAGDATKWGLTDFYEFHETALRAAIESGKPFDTGWFGCKKEIRSGRIQFDGQQTIIQATASSDELADLIDTAIWQACGGNEFAGSGFDALRKLNPSETEDDTEARLDRLIDAYAEDYAETQESTSTTAGRLDWDQTMAVLSATEDEAQKAATEQFDSIVAQLKAELKPEALDK